MTAPIQEPNNERALQGIAFARDQLFRRPAPVSGFTPPMFRGRQTTGGFQTLGSAGTETDITWNNWENCDETVFDYTTSGGNVRTIILLAEGIYSIMWMISVQTIAGAVTAGSQIAMVINDGYDNPVITVHPKQFAGSGGDYLQAGTFSYPPFLSPDNPPGFAEISFDAAQNGGTDRNTRYGTMFEIHYLGPFACTPVS